MMEDFRRAEGAADLSANSATRYPPLRAAID
jgi:hypothetical protein